MSASKSFLIFISLGLATSASARASDCVDAFRAALRGRSLSEKDAIALNLSARTIRCLYERASGEAIEPEFFLDDAHRATATVQAFAGKNSLPIGAYFEKHFFAPSGTSAVYGYNEAAINHFLCSPGFFRVLPNDSDRSRVAFDYSKNLKAELANLELGRIRGMKVKAVKNNTGNLLFGGLLDVMKKIDSDVAVGVALRKGKPLSYFIIARKPEPGYRSALRR